MSAELALAIQRKVQIFNHRPIGTWIDLIIIWVKGKTRCERTGLQFYARPSIERTDYSIDYSLIDYGDRFFPLASLDQY